MQSDTKSHFNDLFLFMYMHLCHTGVSPQGDQKRESHSLEVSAFMSCPTWVWELN